ncbi:MAG: DNA topoisomerase I [Candidatus Thorarchaeota archaeon]|nr:DNA topoisomerase I [Candidatus Thorarchaeota archaeon]
MDTLRHKGVLVLKPPDLPPFEITIRANLVQLTPSQSEMAVAWVKKLGTPYVEDAVFEKNFMMDFSKALKIKPRLKVEDIDFSSVIEYVENERAHKEAMTKEEKKAAREERKAEREALKEEYGFALVDGERMELGSYQTEPSGIFMGRGEHPLRGRWKHGATHRDITLNLDSEAPIPEGDWGKLIWADDCMWIAKWTDELTSSTKYLWLHDSTPIKQEREAAKFNKALMVEKQIVEIRAHIMEGIQSENPKRRAIAAACYLIDSLSLRVGDEKDPEEADTVGATTLRAEHLKFRNDSIVFDFLGKDSVRWHKELDTTPDIYRVLEELHNGAVDRLESFKSRSSRKTAADPKKAAQIFSSINSTHVNRFFGEAMPGLTAKMFRTYHASMIMREELKKSKARKVDPDFIKKAAMKRANLEVARIMNHTKQAPKGWQNSENRYKERIVKANRKIEKVKVLVNDRRKKLRTVKKKESVVQKKQQESIKRQKELLEKYWQSVLSWREKRNNAKVTWDNARERKSKTRSSKRKGKTTKKQRLEGAQESIDRTRARLDNAEEGLKSARARYEKSKESLTKKQDALAKQKDRSAGKIQRAEMAVETVSERVKKAELAKKKIETDYSLAKASRTWNLGTSMKSYVHPKIVYKWCQKVDYDWRKVYTSILQRKFAWIEPS